MAAAGIVVDMIVQNVAGPGRSELSFSVPRSDLERTLELTRKVGRARIDPAIRVAGDPNIARLFVLGVGMRTHTGVARRMFGALAERGINISMINTSEVRVSVVVDRPARRGSPGGPQGGVSHCVICVRRAGSVSDRSNGRPLGVTPVADAPGSPL